MDWIHAGAAVLPAFLASLVEFVEALTIVLAVGVVRGWRPALIGTAAGVALLAALVLLFGPLLQRIPIGLMQLIIGTLLLLFGLRWLRKAALRGAGIIGLHDEEAIYAKQTRALASDGSLAPERLDRVAVATTFKAVVLEGLEVVFIVVATGAADKSGKTFIPACIGAALAGVVVIVLGLVLHRPLSRVPENTLKFAVGVLLSAFGTFWVGEGLGFDWPGADLSLLGLAGGFLLAAGLSVLGARRMAATPVTARGAAR